jgi:prepilin-type N-terminal cleavage/methylation domain-containing protein
MKTSIEPRKTGHRAFTLIELLVVIAIIALLASLGSGVYGSMVESKRIAVAKVQLAGLVVAIDEYESHYGHFPPVNPSQNSATNAEYTSLFYELTGTRFVNGRFESPGFQPTTNLSSAALTNAFGLSGIINHSPASDRLRQFLTLTSDRFAEAPNPAWAGLSDLTPVLLFKVEAPHPDGTIRNNHWRYRLRPADGHNPRGYDLWAEFKGRSKTIVVGNWNQR